MFYMHASIFLGFLIAIGPFIVEGAATSKAPTKAPATPAATKAPATKAPATPAATKAPATPAATKAPTTIAATKAPTTAAAAPSDIGIPPPGAPDPNGCSDKKPCPDKNSDCFDSKCICKEGFTPGGNDTCIKLPSLGEPCKVSGLELYCQGFGIDPNCPINGTLCQCKSGYETDKKNSCKAAVRLVGATCKVDGDCTAAFATCQSGKCACTDGFKADAKSSLCKATTFNCINGDKALVEKGSVRLCEMSVDVTTGEVGNDTCPTEHFCNTWQNTQTKSRGATGHCCPIPKTTKTNSTVTATCAVGVEHKTGKCPDLTAFPADAPLPASVGPFCPLETYECAHGRICCPLACRSSSSHFNVEGKCYDTAIIGQPCELDVQCFPGATCAKGTCQCKSGYKEISSTFCLPPGEQNPFAVATAQLNGTSV